MSQPDNKVLTRATLKLKQKESRENFTPPHRSTEIGSESDPETEAFTRSNKVRRSPERPSTPNSRASTPTPDQGRKPQERTPARNAEKPEKRGEKVEIAGPKKVCDPVASGNRKTSSSTTTHNNAPTTIQIGKMNTTIAESFANPKTPAVPKFLSPPIFNPCSSNAFSFIKTYDRTAAVNNWNDTLKISYFGSFLEGAASLWFSMYTQKQANQAKTWENIKGDFQQEFGDPDIKSSLEKKLAETKQKPHQSITEYYYELQALFGEYDPMLNLREFRKFFERGMNRELYRSYRLVLGDDPTWEEFRGVIRKLQDITQEDISSRIQGLAPDQKECHQCHHMGETSSQNHNYNTGPNWQPQHYRPKYQYNDNRQDRQQTASSRVQYAQLQHPGYSQGPAQPTRYSQEVQYPPRSTQRTEEYRSRQPQFLPNTRSRDGRPRCYHCNRVGHFAAGCPQNRRRSPNSNGRRN